MIEWIVHTCIAIAAMAGGIALGRRTARTLAYWDAADLVKRHASQIRWGARGKLYEGPEVADMLDTVAKHIKECAGKTPLHPMPDKP